jgi:hypothetical protein
MTRAAGPSGNATSDTVTVRTREGRARKIDQTRNADSPWGLRLTKVNRGPRRLRYAAPSADLCESAKRYAAHRHRCVFRRCPCGAILMTNRTGGRRKS